ncbi:SDR family oxidoreductase [Nakamurella sp. PAMC28650]|uniref:SDR family oxidoreductase n=1 Tax=Nakamurella sp. PAMC28650 TaxID=2762325 RepID=UPI00164E4C93|nr:SDR family oxidoreductase [Nakamurella sp. PAMC28650]QNK81949.1 SDR family oxidoreductase [Nakamurella sp. PAMC28650]
MNDTTNPILVTGATGSTGSAIVKSLTDRGVPVRVMVRKPPAAGAFPSGTETVLADFDDQGSLAAALTGVRRAYLVTPSSERAQEQQDRFADQAAASGVERLVVLSQLGSASNSPVRFLRYHAAVEQHIRDIGVDYTFLRPNLFFQGFLAFAGLIAGQSMFFAPIGTSAISAIDVRDIASVAAAALVEDGHHRTTYTLTGPAAITHDEIAEAFSTALGRTITFSDAPPEQFGAALQGILPSWQIDGTLEDYAHYRRGEAADVSTAVIDVTGTPPRDIAQFCRDYAESFRAR